MGESYVRPVTGAHEPPPPWVAVWRFRVIALLLLVVLALATIQVIRILQGAEAQDPGVSDVVPVEDPAVAPSASPS